MGEKLIEILNKINATVWGTPTLLFVFFTGVIISIRTNFFQIKFFKKAFNAFFKPQTKGDHKQITPFQSASTALSATMGTGNIVGVAGAVALGGPGAIFWMWVSAIFCMMIKFAEIALSVRYREQMQNGRYMGGAMFYIKNALPRFLTPLATIFCICGVAAAFGVGNMTQINTMSASVSAMMRQVFNVSPTADFLIKLSVGLISAVCCSFVLKNDGSIGRFCEKTIPIMTIVYICVTFIAIAVNYSNIPKAFAEIFIGAFNPRVVTGGVVGSAFVGLRFGMSRGVFSNEAGLGTAPTAYACSNGDAITLGLMGIMEVFIDTVVVCTLTALTVLCAGEIDYGIDTASNLTLNALSSVYGQKIVFVFCPMVCIFAFSSVVGWGLYGTKFITYLLGENSKYIFLVTFILAQIPAAIFRADVVWVISEILNGLMALPNITALLFLTNEIADITNMYKRKLQGI